MSENIEALKKLKKEIEKEIEKKEREIKYLKKEVKADEYCLKQTLNIISLMNKVNVNVLQEIKEIIREYKSILVEIKKNKRASVITNTEAIELQTDARRHFVKKMYERVRENEKKQN